MPVEPDSVEHVFEGSLFRVEVERWPGGVRRDIVRHPGACGAVVLVGEEVVMVRQFREAARRTLLEIPAGIYDAPNETPEGAVRREIEEETGYVATDVEPLGRILTSPGFTDERIDLFLARARAGGAPAEEGIRVALVPFERAVEMVRAGEVEDAKSAVALLLAEGRLPPTPGR